MKELLRFDGGYPSHLEEERFVEYVLSFYAKDARWNPVYPEVGMTVLGAVQAVKEYLSGYYPCIKENWIELEGKKIPTHIWGGGDSIDREIVRDIFLKTLAKTC